MWAGVSIFDLNEKYISSRPLISIIYTSLFPDHFSIVNWGKKIDNIPNDRLLHFAHFFFVFLCSWLSLSYYHTTRVQATSTAKVVLLPSTSYQDATDWVLLQLQFAFVVGIQHTTTIHKSLA